MSSIKFLGLCTNKQQFIIFFILLMFPQTTVLTLPVLHTRARIYIYIYMHFSVIATNCQRAYRISFNIIIEIQFDRTEGNLP